MSVFLKDPDVQKLAWERYGFRTGILGITNDPAVHEVDGLSKSIDNVMQLPDYTTMERLLGAFEETLSKRTFRHALKYGFSCSSILTTDPPRPD